MNKTLPCIYCYANAKLVTKQRTIQKGIIKVQVPQRFYECPKCERTFRTREQVLEDGDMKAKKLSEVTTITLNKNHSLSDNKNYDATTTKDNH